MTLRPDSEHEARQLAAKFWPLVRVQILAGQYRGREAIVMETGEDVSQIVRGHEMVLYNGLGKDAGPIDQPMAWTETPAWKKGLWLRRTVNLDNSSATTVLEWDGLGVTPDVELPTPDALSVAWLGPLPPMPF